MQNFISSNIAHGHHPLQPKGTAGIQQSQNCNARAEVALMVRGTLLLFFAGHIAGSVSLTVRSHPTRFAGTEGTVVLRPRALPAACMPPPSNASSLQKPPPPPKQWPQWPPPPPSVETNEAQTKLLTKYLNASATDGVDSAEARLAMLFLSAIVQVWAPRAARTTPLPRAPAKRHPQQQKSVHVVRGAAPGHVLDVEAPLRCGPWPLEATVLPVIHKWKPPSTGCVPTYVSTP